MLHLYKFQKMQLIYRDRKHITGYLGREANEVRGISKGQEGTWGDGYVCYLNCDGVHMSKPMKLYTLNMGSLLYVSYSSRKLKTFNHHIATTLVIIDSGKNHQQMLKLIDEGLRKVVCLPSSKVSSSKLLIHYNQESTNFTVETPINVTESAKCFLTPNTVV